MQIAKNEKKDDKWWFGFGGGVLKTSVPFMITLDSIVNYGASVVTCSAANSVVTISDARVVFYNSNIVITTS